jgi:rubrerythrin
MFSVHLMFCCCTLFFVAFPAPARADLIETKSILQNAYRGELRVHNAYAAFSKKAREDKYPNIAYLFSALACSEGIHARNFQKLLTDSGSAPETFVAPELPVGSTKANLCNASKWELEEIDSKYPDYIKRIKQENHVEALQSITYAWESEKQHRELLEQVQSGAGLFFGLLVKKIEATPVEYFVCRECGATTATLPAETCPICGKAVGEYVKVEAGNPSRISSREEQRR